MDWAESLLWVSILVFLNVPMHRGLKRITLINSEFSMKSYSGRSQFRFLFHELAGVESELFEIVVHKFGEQSNFQVLFRVHWKEGPSHESRLFPHVAMEVDVRLNGIRFVPFGRAMTCEFSVAFDDLLDQYLEIIYGRLKPLAWSFNHAV